jgi:Flp pilus assembly pilin Flp
MTEYVLILAAVAVAGMTAYTLLGGKIGTELTTVAAAFPGHVVRRGSEAPLHTTRFGTSERKFSDRKSKQKSNATRES